MCEDMVTKVGIKIERQIALTQYQKYRMSNNQVKNFESDIRYLSFGIQNLDQR